VCTRAIVSVMFESIPVPVIASASQSLSKYHGSRTRKRATYTYLYNEGIHRRIISRVHKEENDTSVAYTRNDLWDEGQIIVCNPLLSVHTLIKGLLPVTTF
jgi:hypothetical protein